MSVKRKRRSEQQIYGRNDMVNIEPNKKIYGSLGKTEKWFLNTVEGNPVTMSNSREGSFGKEVTEFDLYGWSKQKTTTGANLAKPQLESGLINGINITRYDDGSYNFKGTCTSDIYKTICSFNVEIGETYYFSGGAKNGTNTTFQTYILSKKEVLYYVIEKGSFTAKEKEYYLNCAIYKGNTVDFTIKPMLNLGSEALPYELYTGGKPSPSPEYPQAIESVGGSGSIGIEITGKNLLNEDKYYSTYKQTDGTYKVDNVKLNNIIIIFDSSMVGKTYTASCNLNCPNTVSAVLLEANIDGKRMLGNSIPTNKSGISKITFTPKTAKDNIKITYGSGNGEIIFSDFQIEASPFATSYEPYRTPQSTSIITLNGLPGIPVPAGTAGITYTDANGQAWIADEIDLERGKYVQRVWKGEFDGNENWLAYDYMKGFLLATALPYTMTNRAYLSNQYSSNLRIGMGQKSLYLDSSSFYDESLTDKGLSNFKAHLAANPLVVMTYLDTPIERYLTSAELAEYTQLYSYKPTTVVENDSKSHMKITYRATGN